MNLREVHTERLQAELRERRRCLNCHTEHAAGWTALGMVGAAIIRYAGRG